MSLLAVIGGCQKSSINGDLDGMWQVVDVSPEPDNQETTEKLYYNFQLHTCGLSYYGGNLTNGNMIYDGNRLTLSFPNANTEELICALRRYGINENPITFTIETLDRKNLVMTSDGVTVIMRKY